MIFLSIDGTLSERVFFGWDEVIAYLESEEQTTLDDAARLRIKTGHSERVGTRWFRFIPEGVQEILADCCVGWEAA